MVFLALLSQIMGGLACAQMGDVSERREVVEIFVWQPSTSGNGPPLVLPRLSGETRREAVQNYLEEFNSHSKLKKLNGRKPLKISIGKTRDLDRRVESRSARPRFLLLANETDQMTTSLLENPYSRALIEEGADVSTLPVSASLRLNERQAEQFFAKLVDHYNGVLSPGGRDLDPALYSEKIEGSVGFNYLADLSELNFLKYILSHLESSDIHVFGICRGSQLLAVAAGYSLVQEIAKELVHNGNIHAVESEETLNEHPLYFDPKEMGLWREILPGVLQTIINSYHHQGVDFRSNPNGILRFVGFDHPITELEHAVAEAYYLVGRRGFGTQFHPEIMYPDEVGTQVLAHARKAIMGVMVSLARENLVRRVKSQRRKTAAGCAKLVMMI